MGIYHQKQLCNYILRNNSLTSWYMRRMDKRKYAVAREVLQKEGFRIAADVCGRLGSIGYQALPMYGSLLGLVREGAFLKHDNDMDIAVIVKEGFDWASVEKTMKDGGYRKLREFVYNGFITEQAYEVNGLSVDVFALCDADDPLHRRCYFYTYTFMHNYKHPYGLTVKYLDIPLPCDFSWKEYDGYAIPIPCNSEELLSLSYGPGWKTPDPNWKSTGVYFHALQDEGFVRFA